MSTAKLVRSKIKTSKFDLVINGQIIGGKVYNKYHFSATGKTADGSRIDVAADLGITKINFNEYHVANLEAFLTWAEIPAEKAAKIWGVEDGVE